VGDARSDRSGLLLLISPPGYGKTTLMEYIADRLGMIFVRVNGPTLGHEVHSLDPAQAAHRGAADELVKLNLGLAMGVNVMLYVDDIQHCSPEFLQKFISLADGTRRVDAVIDGVARTIDMRGKRFALVMAGNPYTETGEVFRIPDMLANRADVYNLGDVLSGREALFADSYIENALTANPTSAPLAERPREEILAVLRIARGDDETPPPGLPGGVELIELVRRMVKVRDVLGSGQRRLRGQRRAGRCLPHRAAVQAAGQLPQHGQARRAALAADDRCRTGCADPRPLPRRGADARRARRGKPAQAGAADRLQLAVTYRKVIMPLIAATEKRMDLDHSISKRLEQLVTKSGEQRVPRSAPGNSKKTEG
jgi:hypothetical protein